MASIISIMILSILGGLSRAIRDVVFTEGVWTQSVFSKYPKTSFFGPATHTSHRKDRPDNKVLNYLLHNQLAFITDIWHFTAFLSSLFATIALVIAYNDLPDLNIYLVGLGSWLCYATTASVGVSTLFKK